MTKKYLDDSFQNNPDNLYPIVVQDRETSQIILSSFTDKETLMSIQRNQRLSIYSVSRKEKITLPIESIYTNPACNQFVLKVNLDKESLELRNDFRCRIDLLTGEIVDASSEKAGGGSIFANWEKIICAQRLRGELKSLGVPAEFQEKITKIFLEAIQDGVQLLSIDYSETLNTILLEKMANLLYLLQILLVSLNLSWEELEDVVSARQAKPDLALDRILDF